MKADSGIASGAGYISPPEFFKRLKPDADGLERFGFAKNGSAWEYSAKVAEGALVARLTADKVGGDKKDTVEIVNLRRTEGMDASRFLPAYHMNKNTWAAAVVWVFAAWTGERPAHRAAPATTTTANIAIVFFIDISSIAFRKSSYRRW